LIISALVHCIGIFIASLSADDFIILLESFIHAIYLFLPKIVSTYHVSSHFLIVLSRKLLTFGYDSKNLSIYSLDSFRDFPIIFDNQNQLIQYITQKLTAFAIFLSLDVIVFQGKINSAVL
jgi:hypothetical protein